MVREELNIEFIIDRKIDLGFDKHSEKLESNLTKKICVENSPILMIDDVCSLTGLKKSTVYNLVSQRLISCYRPNKKQIYFRMEDVTNYIFNQKFYRKSKNELGQEALSDYSKLSNKKKNSSVQKLRDVK